jgi:hypothetical protein
MVALDADSSGTAAAGVMSEQQMVGLRALEGLRVSVALADGSRIDDCQLVSAGRGGQRTVWVHSNGIDVFVQRADLLDVWEPATSGRAWAA